MVKRREKIIIDGVLHEECRGIECKGNLVPFYDYYKGRYLCKKCDNIQSGIRKESRHGMQFIREKIRLAILHSKQRKFNCPVAPNLEELVLRLWWKQRKKCAITQLPMVLYKDKSEMSIDRIDPDKGYIDGNLQLVIADINIMKGIIERGFVELLNKWGQDIYATVLKFVLNNKERGGAQ
jgi:hypothetical protein